MLQPQTFIEQGRYTCVGEREGTVRFALRGVGIRPLMLLYESAPELLCGAALYDKVIGKAAAMMAVLGGAKSVWGSIMSRSAVEYLASCGVEHGYGQLVERIVNRTGDDLCPLEKTALPFDDPAEAHLALKLRIAELMAGRT